MDRTQYIGSSDAKDILAGNFDRLFCLKTGIREPEDLSDKFHVQIGNVTEPFHLDWTVRRLREEEHNKAAPRRYEWSKFATCNNSAVQEQHFAHFTTPCGAVLGSHPDALLRVDGAHIFPIEAKITGRFRSADEAADFYMPQLQHHMLCWDAERLLFSVSIDYGEPERIWIGASEAWRQMYLDRVEEFWTLLQSGERPAPQFEDYEVRVPTDIADSVPFDGMTRRSLDGDNYGLGLVHDLIRTKAAHAEHEAVKKELKGRVEKTEREVYDTETGFSIKRDKRGALRMKIPDAPLAAE